MFWLFQLAYLGISWLRGLSVLVIQVRLCSLDLQFLCLSTSSQNSIRCPSLSFLGTPWLTSQYHRSLWVRFFWLLHWLRCLLWSLAWHQQLFTDSHLSFHLQLSSLLVLSSGLQQHWSVCILHSSPVRSFLISGLSLVLALLATTLYDSTVTPRPPLCFSVSKCHLHVWRLPVYLSLHL